MNHGAEGNEEEGPMTQAEQVASWSSWTRKISYWKSGIMFTAMMPIEEAIKLVETGKAEVIADGQIRAV